jgi:peptidylprolyl isomerase
MYHKPIMKLTSTFLILAAATAPLAAQTTTPHTARPSGTTAAKPATAAAACVKTPDLSPKIPALPASASCIKHLYTITTVPSVKIDYASPLEGNTLKEALGIEPTTFSLDYVDTKAGTGELAGAHTWYTINYTGYLPDGTKFDSSVDREPIVIHYGEHGVIAGWDTGFAGMRTGGKRRLFIPFQLGYGAQGKGPIPAKSELIFDVELLSISATQPPPKTPPTPPAPPAGAKPAATPPPASTPPPTPPPAAKPAATPPPATTSQR